MNNTAHVCPDCNHHADLHGPDGCVVRVHDPARAETWACRCDRPGNQLDLFGFGLDGDAA